MTFQKWMAKVDKILFDQFGVTSSELPDQLWADMHEDLSPQEAVDIALEDMGYD